MIDWLREDPPKVCGRCDRPVRLPWQKPAPEHHGKRVFVAARRWPDGYICAGCFAIACETYGRCTSCNVDRLVPGIADNGDRLCTDCAGGLGDYTCQRCGEEDWREHVGTCGRCVLRDRLAAVLDDGGGRVRPELIPFYDTVCAMTRPRSGILWLTKPHVPPILRALASGAVPLTHDGLSTLTPWRSVIYVRDLLISSGVLSPVDRRSSPACSATAPRRSKTSPHRLASAGSATQQATTRDVPSRRGPVDRREPMFVGSRGSAAMGFLDKRIADLEAQTRRVWQGSGLTRSVFEQVKHLVGLVRVEFAHTMPLRRFRERHPKRLRQ